MEHLLKSKSCIGLVFYVIQSHYINTLLSAGEKKSKVRLKHDFPLRNHCAFHVISGISKSMHKLSLESSVAYNSIRLRHFFMFVAPLDGSIH